MKNTGTVFIIFRAMHRSRVLLGLLHLPALHMALGFPQRCQEAQISAAHHREGDRSDHQVAGMHLLKICCPRVSLGSCKVAPKAPKFPHKKQQDVPLIFIELPLLQRLKDAGQQEEISAEMAVVDMQDDEYIIRECVNPAGAPDSVPGEPGGQHLLLAYGRDKGWGGHVRQSPRKGKQLLHMWFPVVQLKLHVLLTLQAPPPPPACGWKLSNDLSEPQPGRNLSCT